MCEMESLGKVLKKGTLRDLDFYKIDLHFFEHLILMLIILLLIKLLTCNKHQNSTVPLSLLRLQEADVKIK